MGAYLSVPKTEKDSTDESNDYVVVGASSMQGWRSSQEDAHNSILNFDANASFFAVYDGHGGAEVATYCAEKLPAFLKENTSYNCGEYERALKDAFLAFDAKLLEANVIDVLKSIAKEKNHEYDSDVIDEDEDVENLAELHEEGNLPLDEVMEKYKGHPCMTNLKNLKESDTGNSKPQSPFLRGRRAAAIVADAANKAVLDPDLQPEGSSTSKAALAAASAITASALAKATSPTSSDDNGPSSSHSIEQKYVKSDSSAEAEAKSSATISNTANGNINYSSSTLIHKDSDQNGNVSSSEVKTINEKQMEPLKIIPTAPKVNNEATASESNEADVEPKHNGIINTDSDALPSSEANDAAITSTSKEVMVNKTKTCEVMAADAKKKHPNFYKRRNLELSSDDDEDDEDEEEEEEDFHINESEESDDAGYDEDDESCEEEEEDEETFLANEKFCANMIEEPGKDSGCTAVVSLLVGRDLYVANAGDSRCVVCRNGKAIEMSLDHKPEDDEESTRIIKAGGRVTMDGRVNGGLNLSRAIGDHGYKMNKELPADEQMISAMPDIKKLIITADDEFMILACDGIWNFMSSEDVVDFVRARLKDETKKMSEICEELFDTCLAPNTLGDGTGCDNMTAVIVRFKPSILNLPTNIDPKETEDILMSTNSNDATPVEEQCEITRSLKRAATPSIDDECENEAKTKTKRFKTDVINSSTTIPTISTTADVTTSNSSSPRTVVYERNDVECDSLNANEAQAASEITST